MAVNLAVSLARDGAREQSELRPLIQAGRLAAREVEQVERAR